MDDRSRLEDAKTLLSKAAIYQKYEAGRRKPLDVFSVLNIERDEVRNCRFLAALLDHRKSKDSAHENLVDFLKEVVDLNPTGDNPKVEREAPIDGGRIDILITTNTEAVAIEDKINYATDQPNQLEKYYNYLKNKGYGEIRLLYMSLDGHEPDEESVGNLACKSLSSLSSLSYGDSRFLAWLERCQQRTHDEPKLRESIAQYALFIRRLTGMDKNSDYMIALKELCLEDHNMVLVHDLKEALLHARVSLMYRIWCEIEQALDNLFQNKSQIRKSHISCISEDRIEKFLRNRRGDPNDFGLYYDFGRDGALLGVEANIDLMIYGVRCREMEHRDKYEEIRQELSDMKDNHKRDWWPWFRVAMWKGRI